MRVFLGMFCVNVQDPEVADMMVDMMVDMVEQVYWLPGTQYRYR